MTAFPFAQCIIALSLLLCSVEVSNGQSEMDWPASLIDKDQLKFDFGIVARGQEVRHKIRIRNSDQDSVKVTPSRTSQGVQWESPLIPLVIPGSEERFVTLYVDTLRFQGIRKGSATLDVVKVDHAKSGCITIQVEGFIRSDIRLEPGSVHFDSVEPAKDVELRLSLKYEGRNDWQLLSASCASPHIETQLTETARQQGKTEYEVLVTLKKTAPMGVFTDRLELKSNDQEYADLMVPIDAIVEPDIRIRVGQIGVGQPGESRLVNVVVRRSRTKSGPFKIENVESIDDRVSTLTHDQKAKKLVHLLKVKVVLPDVDGPFEHGASITTDIQVDPIAFKIRGEVRNSLTRIDE